MVSGKYSALAGAISREQAIANIGVNLANINTSGYKKSSVSFESVLRGQQQTNEAKGINYNRIRNTFTDFSPGAMRQTENPLDVAITGEGFFKLKGPNTTLYTRRGDFTIDDTGLLTTTSGLPVLDDSGAEITIPDTDTSQVAIGDDGTVYILGPQGTRSEVAKIAIVDVDDRLKLKREPDTTFSLAAGGKEIASEGYRILQGNLELSNVNMAAEMTRMIDTQRTFETYQKVLKGYSGMGEQLQELGTVG